MTWTTPENFTSMAQVLNFTNDITGGLAIPLLFTVVPSIILFVITLPFGLSTALIMALFFGTLTSLFMNVVGVVTTQVVMIFTVLTAAAIIGTLVLKNKGGGI